jgi:6-phosphogluconolactonase
MPINRAPIPAKMFVVGMLTLAATSCGTTRSVVCPLASGSNSTTCACGSGTDACPINPGPEFLYARTVTGQILAFDIDRGSGVLTAVGSVPGPSLSYGLTAVNHQFLFASDRSQGQLDGFSIDQTTGALTTLQGSPFPTGTLTAPAGLASPPNSSFLYAADVAAVDAFTVSSTGIPSAVSGSPFPSGSGISLATDPNGQFLYAPDADSGGVVAFTIGSTGALTAVSGSPFTVPGESNGLPSGIIDTGSYVYTTLSLDNQIAAFSVVSGTGALTPVSNSPFSAGTSPTAIVFASESPSGFLYALNNVLNTGTMSGYSIDTSTGVLTPLSGFPLSIEGFSMAIDSPFSLGEYLYVASSTGIQAFSIDGTSGALTPLSGSPFAAAGANLLTLVQIPPS